MQQGGTGLLLCEGLIDQCDFEASDKDATGLDRWVYMLLKGEDGVKTRFVCGCNPCPSEKKQQSLVTSSTDVISPGKKRTEDA